MTNKVLGWLNSLSGNNLIIGPHVKKQIAFLRRVVPEYLQHKKMDDLGCGDGKTTLILKEVYKPSRLRGFDVNPSLVQRARNRGIDAEVCDLSTGTPSGELAVLWGVLHHLPDPADCINRVKENYPHIYIREPLKHGFFKGLELGHPFELEEFISMADECLPGSQIHLYHNSIMLFYSDPEYAEN